MQLKYEIQDYEVLMNFDLESMLNHPQAFSCHSDDTLRILICTHGKFDPCCAVDGSNIYRHLRTRDDVEI